MKLLICVKNFHLVSLSLLPFVYSVNEAPVNLQFISQCKISHIMPHIDHSGAKIIFGGKLTILIFAICSVFEFLNFIKKGMHWLGLGSKIGLHEKLGKF